MHETDEEQIEAIKKWFAQWGNYLIGAVLAIVVGYGGFWFYQDQQAQSRVAASDQYQVVLRLVESEAALTGDALSDLQSAVSTLMEDHGGTTYSLYGQMHLARQLVLNEELTQAAEVLSGALSEADDSVLGPVINLRLARVRFELEEFDSVLTTLDAVAPGAHQVSYDELRGDVHAARGNRDQARAAYEAAWQAAQDSGVQRPLLQVKAANYGVM